VTVHQGSDTHGTLQIDSRIVIDAPAGLVWTVTLGIADWPTWSPTVRAAQLLSGEPLTEGSRFLLSQPFQSSRLW
jgi:uncharacterized membrane protein